MRPRRRRCPSRLPRKPPESSQVDCKLGLLSSCRVGDTSWNVPHTYHVRPLEIPLLGFFPLPAWRRKVRKPLPMTGASSGQDARSDDGQWEAGLEPPRPACPSLWIQPSGHRTPCDLKKGTDVQEPDLGVGFACNIVVLSKSLCFFPKFSFLVNEMRTKSYLTGLWSSPNTWMAVEQFWRPSAGTPTCS